MLQTLSCIRMGEVLLDENLQVFILCNNCHTDLRNLQDFRRHLEKCEGLENLFQQGNQHCKYNTDKSTQLFGKTLKGIKEFLIYDYNDVDVTYNKQEENFIDLINIEQELLDPKWYSDLNVEVENSPQGKSSKQYDELVEAVTPFVQFKENFKSNNNGKNNVKSSLVKSSTELKVNTKETQKSKSVKFDLTTNNGRPTAKRKLSMPKPIPTQLAIKTKPTEINSTTSSHKPTPISYISKDSESKKQKFETISNGFLKQSGIQQLAPNTLHTAKVVLPTTVAANGILNSVSRKPKIISSTIIKQEPTKEKQTAQILNKLQNLGLQVKRTQPPPQTLMSNSSAANKTDTKTLEILQRLQSKGMKVKILSKQQTTQTNINIPTVKPLQGIGYNPAQKVISFVHNLVGDMPIKQNLNRNLIIKKVN